MTQIDDNMYYTEPIEFIKVQIVYLNASNEIEKTIEDTLFLKEFGIIKQHELNDIVNHYSITDYSLFSIATININIQPNNLKNFLTNHNLNNQFLNQIDKIDEIHFERSISMFHDINELIIFLQHSNALNMS